MEDLIRERNEAELEVVAVRKELADAREQLEAARRDSYVRETAMQKNFHRRLSFGSEAASHAPSHAEVTSMEQLPSDSALPRVTSFTMNAGPRRSLSPKPPRKVNVVRMPRKASNNGLVTSCTWGMALQFWCRAATYGVAVWSHRLSRADGSPGNATTGGGCAATACPPATQPRGHGQCPGPVL